MELSQRSSSELHKLMAFVLNFENAFLVSQEKREALQREKNVLRNDWKFFLYNIILLNIKKEKHLQ